MVFKMANYYTNVPPPGKDYGVYFHFPITVDLKESATRFSAGYTLALWQFSWSCTFERLIA